MGDLIDRAALLAWVEEWSQNRDYGKAYRLGISDVVSLIARAAPSPALTREALAAAHHHGCCSDSLWRMVQFRWLPAESCREYHLQMAERTLVALSKTPPPTEEEANG